LREYTVHLPRPHTYQAAFIDSLAKRKIIRAGRRGGKTVGSSVLAVRAFLAGRRVLYAAPTQEQVSTFWSRVVTALWEPIEATVYRKNETLHLIELPQTAQRIRAKTAWNADTLRGDYADLLILDEYQLMDEDAWELVGAPMLLDNNGDAVFIYTPPSLRSRSVSKARDPQHARKLFEKYATDTTGRWATFHFTSHDNPYLNRDALSEITQDMTQAAYRMEIMAEDLDEAPGALWTHALIDRTRVPEPPDLTRIVVGIDPAATSGPDADETGIIVAGLGSDGHGYILDDLSGRYTPAEWGAKAVRAYDTWKADRIVPEVNNGGEMVTHTVQTAARDLGIPVRVVPVRASRGKVVRAEPIVALFEQNKIHLTTSLPALEDQLCLAPETRIQSQRGPVRICEIRAGDFVATRDGWQRVAWAGRTGSALLMALRLHCGAVLEATPGHPIATPRGFIPAGELALGDEVLACRCPLCVNTASLPGSSISLSRADISAQVVSAPDVENSCIDPSGALRTVRFRKDTPSTTSTGTDATIALKTWPVSPTKRTLPSTPRVGSGYGHALVTNRLPDVLGTSGCRAAFCVNDAERNSSQRVSAQHSAHVDVGASPILSISPSRKSPVWNLTVDGTPEFLANGVLTHNCLWVPGEASPDRLDALVWACTDLLLGRKRPEWVIV